MSSHKPSAYAIPVIDLIHRPGEYRETELDVVAPERLGNAVIAVEKGEEVHVDARLESLHDGILVSADVDTVASGECVSMPHRRAASGRSRIPGAFRVFFRRSF